ncbi:chemotaxis protein CheA, partial [Pontibacterium sp.]|uniref:chemotaxis protein CheA n=1 Tax=Pontibacterium sp. TaxID=2036026 RepID=UPI0035659ABB
RAADRKANDNGGSIRVSTQKIDALINMAGELVITQAMLAQLGEKLEDTGLQEIEHLRDGLAQLERNSRELQDAVMSIRMLPISFAFSRFPRMIRDLATKFDKKVRLVTTGEQTELDKTVMEKIGDPLVHLVRNSFDHGIEMPQDRLKAGKDETGTIELNAYHQGGNIVIEVIDDGKGLDREVIIAKAREKELIGPDEQVPEDKALELIFEPGFSTAAQVSDLSGRGVGMDVVRRNIRDLGGHIELESEQGKGTRFTIRLPLTLAILDGQLVTVGNETFIVPLISIVESLQIQPEHMKTVAGQTELYHLRDEYIPVVKLNELFSIKRHNHTGAEHDLLVVVEGDGKKIGLQVDDLLGQQQAFIKSLETNFKPVTGISGATILGDGTVSLILDAGAIVRLSSNSGT